MAKLSQDRNLIPKNNFTNIRIKTFSRKFTPVTAGAGSTKNKPIKLKLKAKKQKMQPKTKQTSPTNNIKTPME